MAWQPQDHFPPMCIPQPSHACRRCNARPCLALFGEEDLLHYSLLIASYAQTAILLCIVGQELHEHQTPGLPE
jgi:hypothetical protein